MVNWLNSSKYLRSLCNWSDSAVAFEFFYIKLIRNYKFWTYLSLIFRGLLFRFFFVLIGILFDSFIFSSIFHFLSYFRNSISIDLLAFPRFTTRFAFILLFWIRLFLLFWISWFLLYIFLFILRFRSFGWIFRLRSCSFGLRMSRLSLRFLTISCRRGWKSLWTHGWEGFDQSLTKHLLNWYRLPDLKLLHSTFFALIKVDIN